MMNLMMSIIGWSGVIFCTLVYLFLSMKLTRADSLAFQVLNVLGGLCLAITALDIHDLPNAAVNVLWISNPHNSTFHATFTRPDYSIDNTFNRLIHNVHLKIIRTF